MPIESAEAAETSEVTDSVGSVASVAPHGLANRGQLKRAYLLSGLLFSILFAVKLAFGKPFFMFSVPERR